MQEYEFPETLKLYVYMNEDAKCMLKFQKGTYYTKIGQKNQYGQFILGIYVYDEKLKSYILEHVYKERLEKKFSIEKKRRKRKKEMKKILDKLFPGG